MQCAMVQCTIVQCPVYNVQCKIQCVPGVPAGHSVALVPLQLEPVLGQPGLVAVHGGHGVHLWPVGLPQPAHTGVAGASRDRRPLVHSVRVLLHVLGQVGLLHIRNGILDFDHCHCQKGMPRSWCQHLVAMNRQEQTCKNIYFPLIE